MAELKCRPSTLGWHRSQPSVAGGGWRAVPSLRTGSCGLHSAPGALCTGACLSPPLDLPIPAVLVCPCHRVTRLSERSVDTQAQLGGKLGRCPQHGNGDGDRGTRCIVSRILLVRLVLLRCKTESPRPGLGWAPLLFSCEQTQTLQMPY